jgi:hypothetical protein
LFNANTCAAVTMTITTTTALASTAMSSSPNRRTMRTERSTTGAVKSAALEQLEPAPLRTASSITSRKWLLLVQVLQ